MDAQTRRERRQAKIREGGQNRLEKITGKKPEPETFQSNEVTTNATASVKGEKENYDEDPPESEPEIPNMSGDTNMSGIPEERMNDPLFQMLSQMQNQMGENMGPQTGENEPGMNQSDPFTSMFNAMMAGQSPLGGGSTTDDGSAPFPPQQQKRKPIPKTSDVIWMVIHLVGSIILALHVVSQPDLVSTLVWKFSTMQIILHSSRFLMERGAPPANSMISSFAGYLPQPFNGYLITAARYLQFASLIFKDATMILFVIGLYSFYVKESEPEGYTS